NRDGVNARALLDIARRHGLRGRGVKVDTQSLADLPCGAILHWDFNHFVVFDRMRRAAVELVDPALGRRRITVEQFRKSFTGVALILEPADGFNPVAGARHTMWDPIKNIISSSAVAGRI